ncbi:hypothetical protein [Sorangium sp. So ce385]|uniref:hypothetical protein n=1 Tax=Sorangium sp. So ce385 TaxID=3133308 RepID=UPI003F5AFFB2
MIRLLADSPLLLLFVVSALGFLVGRLQIGGFHLGVAVVLFVGLGVGAVDPALQLPEFVPVFGLARGARLQPGAGAQRRAEHGVRVGLPGGDAGEDRGGAAPRAAALKSPPGKA